MFTLTADQTKYAGPVDAYIDWCEGRALGEFARRGREAGLLKGRYFGFTEFQRNEWPHYHLLAQVTPEFYRRLDTAYRRNRGRGIIEINNTVVAPLWRNGFTCTTLGMDSVDAALYGAAYGVSEGKDHQRTLPPWYDEWSKRTGHKRMTKWTFSRGFWGTPAPTCKTQHETETVPRVQRSTRVVLEGCGRNASAFFVESDCTDVDRGTGEVLREGHRLTPIGRAPLPVDVVAETLRSHGLDVHDQGQGRYSFSLADLRLASTLIEGKWFNLRSALKGIEDERERKTDRQDRCLVGPR